MNSTYPCPACPEGSHTHFEWHQLGMVCSRCNHHTGNENQGHYWKFCSKEAAFLDDFHFCCPGLPCTTAETLNNDRSAS